MKRLEILEDLSITKWLKLKVKFLTTKLHKNTFESLVEFLWEAGLV